MSATGIVVFGVSYDVTVLVGGWLVHEVISKVGDRLSIPAAKQPEQAAPQPALLPPADLASRRALPVADGNRPPDGRERYNHYRDQGMEREDAQKAAGIKERTAREYEGERRRIATQNGAGS